MSYRLLILALLAGCCQSEEQVATIRNVCATRAAMEGAKLGKKVSSERAYELVFAANEACLREQGLLR